MTSAKRRKLQALYQQQRQQQKQGDNNSMNERTKQTDEPGEQKPLKITKHFMAEWDKDTWFVYRLMDFLNPALEDGPQAAYSSSDQVEVERLMGALDSTYDQALAREASSKQSS